MGVSTAVCIRDFLDSKTKYGAFVMRSEQPQLVTCFAATAIDVFSEKKLVDSSLAHAACAVMDLRMIGDYARGKNLALPEIVTECLKKYAAADSITAKEILEGVREHGWLLVWDHAEAVLDHLSSSEQARFLYQLFCACSGENRGKVLVTCASNDGRESNDFWISAGMGLYGGNSFFLMVEA